MKQDSLISAADIASAEGSGLETAKPRVSFYTKYGKRLFDVVLALILLPLLTPVMLVIAAGMSHRGNIIFKQVRVGKSGKLFTIYKFRTMRIDAEAFLEKLCATNPDLAREWAVNQSLDPDPRITKTGLILRKTKLDELPRLANIMLGDMSFVGPRPFITSQEDIYISQSCSSAYYDLRPGLTGPWQLDFRRKQSFIARAQYDAGYATKCTFGLDLRIILRTACVPFKIANIRNKNNE